MEHKITFNLDALLVFAKVVETQSISKAANLLGMPKSTVSRQINKLEGSLGVELLRKSTRNIAVTDFGLEIYDNILAIQDQAHSIQALTHDKNREPQGTLRVAIPVWVGGTGFMSSIGQVFLQEFPKASIEMLSEPERARKWL